jgi:cyclopropane fatty-acyl-phospholipid synthase-like methyltransferase
MPDFLKSRDDISYIGVDNNEKYIRINRNKFQSQLHNVQFFVYDLFDKTIWEDFDVIVAVDVFQYMERDQVLKVFQNIGNASGSYLFLTVLNTTDVLAKQSSLQLLNLMDPVCKSQHQNTSYVKLLSLPILTT